MISIKEISMDEIKNTLNGYLQKHPEIEVAYIFGSVAQGKITPLSDIDIAILIDSDQFDATAYRYGYKAEILSDFIKLLKNECH